MGILKDVSSSLLKGTPLLAPGIEGINGLTISNAIHLSGWTGKTVDVKDFPHDEFYNILCDKIKESKVDKSGIKQRNSDTSNTY